MLPERQEEMDRLKQQLEVLKSKTNTIDAASKSSDSHSKPEIGGFGERFLQ